MTLRNLALLSAAVIALTSCGGADNDKKTETETTDKAAPFASTYQPMPSDTTFITNAYIIDGAGGEIENGSILITNGRITAIGSDISGGDAAVEIDASGKYVTPGIIDIHSHLRMGNVAGYRENWIKAAEYKAKRDKGGDDFKRNLQLETLADVLDGKILVQMHCYRADEMAQILDVAKEFDYKVTTFHHAIEAYKIIPQKRLEYWMKQARLKLVSVLTL